MMNKPDVDSIEGLSPAISIDQKTTSRNPRSTVGTVTEIYDYLRLLFARVGRPHCPVCGKPISRQGPDEIESRPLLAAWNGQKVELLAPIAGGRKAGSKRSSSGSGKPGSTRSTSTASSRPQPADAEAGQEQEAYASPSLSTNGPGYPQNKERLHEAIESALKEGKGVVIARIGKKETVYSRHNACPEHGISLGEIQPRDFSFNAPFGACPECHGLGFKMEFDPDLVMPDRSRSIAGGAIICYKNLMEGGWRMHQIHEVAFSNGDRPGHPSIRGPGREAGHDPLWHERQDEIHIREQELQIRI